MPLNRRNYYRMLFVQPDAPLPVIKAAYRTLAAAEEQTSGSTSVLLTEAYSVLVDPVRRAAYDAKSAVRAEHTPLPDLVSTAMDAGAPPVAPPVPFPSVPAPKAASPWPTAPKAPPAKAPPAMTAAAARPAAPAAPVAPAVPAVACPMCQAPRPGRITVDTRCDRCHAPLAPVARPTRTRATAGNERRLLPRVGRSDWATMHAPWNAEAVRVRLRDLSADGISIYSSARVAPGTRVRIGNERFDLVATVVGCRTVRHVYSLHARLETAWVAPKTATL